jgi:hypothetical protein
MALSWASKWLKSSCCKATWGGHTYQKEKIIGSLRHIDEALDRMATEPFFVRFNRGDMLYMPYGRGDAFGTKHALFYEEALFLNYVLDSWKFDADKLSPYEKKDYNTAVEKLRKWKDIHDIRKACNGFIGEIRRIVAMRRFVHSRLHLAEIGYPSMEHEVLTKYEKLLDDLKGYPAWQEKAETEVGHHVKLLFDEVGNLQISDSPFKDFDLHKYFK